MLVLIVATDSDEFYRNCERMWRQRMQAYQLRYPMMQYYFLKCRSTQDTEVIIDEAEHDVYVRGEESVVPGIGRKTMRAFELLSIKAAYDYTLRSNISSVFLLDRYYAWLKHQPRVGLYAGPPEPYGCMNKPQWAFGAGYTISRDVAVQIVQNQGTLIRFEENIGTIEDIFDDVYVGQLVLTKLRLPLVPTSVLAITDAYSVNHFFALLHNFADGFHIRIKLKGLSRNIEINLQSFLNKRIIQQLEQEI